MKTKIEPGAVIDAVSGQELKDGLDLFTRNWFRERAAGITVCRFDGSGTVASNSVQIPKTGVPDPIGPFKGFAWVIRSIRVAGLATNDVINIYRNVTNDNKLVGQMTAATPFYNPGGSGLVLLGEEKLIFKNSGNLAATGDITVNGEGAECPEPDLYKLLS